MNQQIVDSLIRDNYSIKIIKNNTVEEKFFSNTGKLGVIIEGDNDKELMQLMFHDLQIFKEIRVFNLQKGRE